jgi:NhaP-type Na+/H+ or K+/H+ antiporter
MTEQPRKLEVFANPFFVVLLGASILFVLTVLGYWVSLSVLQPEVDRGPRGAASLALATWLDRNGPLALAVEFIVMLVSGIVAMATDHWFSPRRGKTKE